ncbi:type III secretion system protein [Salmonella enterica]
MSLSVSGAQTRPEIFQSQLDGLGNIANAGSNAVTQQMRSTQGIVSLVGTMLPTLINGQSLRADNTVLPTLAMPQQSDKKVDAQKTADYVLQADNVNVNDVKKLEEMAASLSGAFTGTTKETAGFSSVVLAPLMSNMLQNGAESRTSSVSEFKVEAGAEQNTETVQVPANQKEGDANKLERTAVSAATLFSSQINISQANNKVAENSKSNSDSSASTAISSSSPTRSQAAVEGGTDITAADAAGPRFINVLGDLRLVDVSNKLVTVLTKAEREFNVDSASSLIRMTEAAARSGNKTIDAAKQQMTGAIASGAFGMIAQTGTTFKTTKALNGERNSINKNVGQARNLEKVAREREIEVKKAGDQMLAENKPLDPKVAAGLKKHVNETKHAAAQRRDAHDIQQLDTQKTRVMMEQANQAIRSTQSVVEGAYGVDAAEETKQADLARADQSVNTEVSNTQQQTAKKAAETKASLQQTIENAQNNLSNTSSTIAERMR